MIDGKPIANPSVALREEFDDWAILFDPDSGSAFGINPVSAFIWKQLDGTNTVQQVAAEVNRNCNNVPEDVEQHITDFLNDLIEKGMAGFAEDIQ